MSDILGERDAAVPDVPTRVAEPSRESQLPKRFYEAVTCTDEGGVFHVLLDGRSVKTPGKRPLATTSREIAEIMAGEWQAQDKRIDPMTMPVTRLLNTAIDGVADDTQAVKEDIIRFAGTDMLCYRAERPEGLVERQTELWDPVLDWAQTALSARFELAAGVMHLAQPPESIAAFSVHVGQIDDPTKLTAVHMLTTITGSAVLAMAVLNDAISADEAWKAAHLDEDWNIELWGEDSEAMTRRNGRHRDYMAAVQVVQALSHSA